MKATKFDLHELVILHWNGKAIATRIVQRLFNPDEDCWFYKVANSDRLFSEDNLDPR